MKTKINSHGNEVTDFDEILKVGSNHIYLTVINLDSSLKKDENYYSYVLLKKNKYNEKKAVKHIYEHLSDFSSSDKSHEYDEE